MHRTSFNDAGVLQEFISVRQTAHMYCSSFRDNSWNSGTKYVNIDQNRKKTDAQTNNITYLASLRRYIKLPCVVT